MQMKKYLKKVIAGMLALTLLFSTQVYAGDDTSAEKLNLETEGYVIELVNGDSVSYTGKAVEPEVRVVKKEESGQETTLESDKYDVTYSDNQNVGTAKVKVTGNEEKNVTGTLEKNFTISAVSLKDSTITLDGTSFVYSGASVKPAVSVKLNDVTLKENVDYTVSYVNNSSVGMAKAVITGKGNYTGSNQAEYKIVPDKATLTASSAYKMVKLSWDKVLGAKGYKVYRSTSKDGKYTGIKNIASGSTTSYTDKTVSFNKTYYYKIYSYATIGEVTFNSKLSDAVKQKVQLAAPATGKVTSTSTASKCSATVTWEKVTGANGYRVYRSTTADGTYKAIKTVGNTTSYKDQSVTCGKVYYYKVKAYRTVNKEKCYGYASDEKHGRVLPGTTSIKNSSECFTNKVILKWNKVAGASGYEVYRSVSKNGKYSLVKTIKSGSTVTWTNTGLKGKQYYYYKIRAYRTADGKKYYGGFSGKFRKGVAGWKYINGYKLYYDAKGNLVKDVSKIIGKQSSYVIKVNKKMNVVTVYAKDGDKGYIIPVKSFVCSGGNATPIGTFYTPAKYRWQTLMGPCYGQWCTRIHGGVLFHSVFYSTHSNSTLSVNAYNKLGTTCSHGCVRLRAGDAKWIYDNCQLKTKVIIYNSSYAGPFGKPKAAKLASWHTWDPTDPTARAKCKAHGCH